MASLPQIADAFERIERGEPVDPSSAQIFRAGISMGGARPKAVVQYGDYLWIAKFQRRTDSFDECQVEHATMRLAARCGIDVAETQTEAVGPRRVVLVKRFDRTPGAPFHPTGHYLSALTALDLAETSHGGSYREIAGFLRRYSAAHLEDRVELFRRMVFNVLVGNRDDHLKNHAVIYRPSVGWRLTPAFDVVPQPDFDPVQAISVGRGGTTASLANCLSQCGEFGLQEDAARALAAEMVARLRDWRAFFAECGVDPQTIGRVAAAFSRDIDPPA